MKYTQGKWFYKGFTGQSIAEVYALFTGLQGAKRYHNAR